MSKTKIRMETTQKADSDRSESETRLAWQNFQTFLIVCGVQSVHGSARFFFLHEFLDTRQDAAASS